MSQGQGEVAQSRELFGERKTRAIFHGHHYLPGLVVWPFHQMMFMQNHFPLTSKFVEKNVSRTEAEGGGGKQVCYPG